MEFRIADNWIDERMFRIDQKMLKGDDHYTQRVLQGSFHGEPGEMARLGDVEKDQILDEWIENNKDKTWWKKYFDFIKERNYQEAKAKGETW